MESNDRFYSRRAGEEEARASRAVTPAAWARHAALATHFRKRARECQELSPARIYASR
jgi:hypothetical protein